MNNNFHYSFLQIIFLKKAAHLYSEEGIMGFYSSTGWIRMPSYNMDDEPSFEVPIEGKKRGGKIFIILSSADLPRYKKRTGFSP